MGAGRRRRGIVGAMRIGICQLNPTIGDFAGNARKIAAAYRDCVALGADLVITPELSVCGYPPVI